MLENIDVSCIFTHSVITSLLRFALENSIDARSSTVKKNTLKAVISVHVTKNKFSHTLASPKKMYFRFCPHEYYSIRQKIFNRHSTFTERKTRFWLQYYYGAWDLKKTQSAIYPHRKINIFLFPATVRILFVSRLDWVAIKRGLTKIIY